MSIPSTVNLYKEPLRLKRTAAQSETIPRNHVHHVHLISKVPDYMLFVWHGWFAPTPESAPLKIMGHSRSMVAEPRNWFPLPAETDSYHDRRTLPEARAHAVMSVRGWCHERGYHPNDVNADLASGLLVELARIDPDTLAAEYYRLADQNELDEFKDEWNLTRLNTRLKIEDF